jgi:7-cyano-7-deazaguanine synthase in queuosine biosynthesis
VKVVLLNSGGLDSALKAKELKNAGHEVHSLFLEFKGQLGIDEIRVAAQKTADNYCDSHHTVYVDFGYTPNHYEDSNGFMMYDDYAANPKSLWVKSDGNPPHLWSGPPNQSSVMISLAVSYAKSIGADGVAHGYWGSITPDAALKYKEALEASISVYHQNKPTILFNDLTITKEEKQTDLESTKGEFDYVAESTPEEK